VIPVEFNSVVHRFNRQLAHRRQDLGQQAFLLGI